MGKKLMAELTKAECEEVLFTGGLQVGDVVRSAPRAAKGYPYVGGIHEKEPCFGIVQEFKSAGRGSDEQEHINPVVRCFDGKIVHRHYSWWTGVNIRELAYLRKKYGHIECSRVLKGAQKDYDPLLKEINRSKLSIFAHSLWERITR